MGESTVCVLCIMPSAAQSLQAASALQKDRRACNSLKLGLEEPSPQRCGRPDASGCGCTGLRLAHRHLPQVPPGPQGLGLPVCFQVLVPMCNHTLTG